MELWDIYDIHKQKTGKTMQRTRNKKDGDLHLVVHACIFNSQSKMLIQKRVNNKDAWPGLWDITVGGSAHSGETSQDAVSRELKEELGINYSFDNVRPKLTLNFKHGFDDIYLIDKDLDIEDLVFQEDEVEEAKWASKEEIIDLITEGEFIPYFPSLITFLFDSRNVNGGMMNEDNKYID